jgi:hypothetical protein
VLYSKFSESILCICLDSCQLSQEATTPPCTALSLSMSLSLSPWVLLLSVVLCQLALAVNREISQSSLLVFGCQ